jgi:nitrite reductase/ring-hydroxylating ferredoxin subunit
MDAPRSQRLFAASELREGRMRASRIGNRELLVCRTSDGFFALDNLCTHAEARMSEGRLKALRILCPLHGAAFDVRDGRVLCGPATLPLRTYRVSIVDGQVEVEDGNLPEAVGGAVPATPGSGTGDI